MKLNRREKTNKNNEVMKYKYALQQIFYNKAPYGS